MISVSYYLEWVKPGMDQPMDKAVYEKTVSFFTELMQLLHPYMPFVTEEIYHLLAPRYRRPVRKTNSACKIIRSHCIEGRAIVN